MQLFSNLSDRLSHIFQKLSNRGRLSELEVKETMREIRIALLEADVSLLVAKDFVARVSEKAVGEEVLQSLSPTQSIIKIVNEELVQLLGGTVSKLAVSSQPPTIIMLCGLQGAGKTSMCGKLAHHLKKQGKKPLLVACDIYRPAAITQLQVVAKSAGVDCFEKGSQNPVKTAKEAIAHALKTGHDTVILDTAGRLHINQELMTELVEIKKACTPNEILLTVDAMTGQDAVIVAQSFHEQLDITGVILTKLDGDTRGGAALSLRHITGKPIKFTGIGEKIGDLEPFYPDRVASRILGMGDVLTLIEKAQQNISESQLKDMEKKFLENSFTFEDYLSQMENMSKMGSITDILGMIPGLGGKLKSMPAIDESALKKNKAIIQSMTVRERRHPELIKGSQKKRIAQGSGTAIQEVNQLLKGFEQSKELMKQLKGKRGFKGLF